MMWTYKTYRRINYGISFGLVVVSIIIVSLLRCCGYSKLLYSLVNQMFGVQYTLAESEDQSDRIDLFGKTLMLKKKSTYRVLSYIILCIMTGVVIGVTVIVFVDGVILNVIYLPTNHKCPDDSDMNCYSTSGNYSYFFCNSSELLIPESLGAVTCFKWFKKDMSTLLILEYLGICTGLFQIYNWLVQLYLRLVLCLFTAMCQNSCTCFLRFNFGFGFIFLSFLALIITILILFGREISVTGLTMAVLFCATIIMIMTWLLLVVLTMNAIKEVESELSSVPTAPDPSERAVKPLEQSIEMYQKKPTASVKK
jgi:hypothetical protein